MPTRIRLIGSTKLQTAYSIVNHQWKNLLEASGHTVHLEGVEPVNVAIHHDYSQDFSAIRRPENVDRFITVRTWDFGPYPPSWIDVIQQQVDQLWVYTDWIRQQAVQSGLAESKVKVISHSVDSNTFRSDGVRYTLPTRKSFRFLFVGAAVMRKGVDILLKAYQQAFSSIDDVTLVIKDHTANVFYQGQSLKVHIERLSNEADTPEIIYIDDYLPLSDLAALYRSCDVGVFPYRAEGFCIPIMEAMASGLPCIVPNFGACLDYCSPETSYFVPARRIWLPVSKELAYNTLGFKVEVNEVDFCEVSVDALAQIMRSIFEADLKERARKSILAMQAIQTQFSDEILSHRLTTLLQEIE